MNPLYRRLIGEISERLPQELLAGRYPRKYGMCGRFFLVCGSSPIATPMCVARRKKKQEPPVRNIQAGWHLVYDAVVTPSCAKLLEEVPLKRFLLRLMVDLQLEVPSDLEVVVSEGTEGLVVAIGGVCAGGNIRCHAWPSQRRFSLDLYSRSKFSRVEAEKMIADSLGTSQKWVRWLEREWPF